MRAFGCPCWTPGAGFGKGEVCRTLRSPLLQPDLFQVETGILKREPGLGFGLEQRLEGNEYYREERTFLEKKSESLGTRITALLLGEGGKGSKGKL